MLDLISIGTVTIDLYYKGESLTHTKDRFELAVGGKYFSEIFYQGLGGGGANVAIGVAKHDLKTALVAHIGENPFKKIIQDKLEAEKVRYDAFCSYHQDYLNISSILLTEKGEKTIVNYRTPHQHIVTCDADYELFLKSKAIYLASLSSVALTERINVLQFAQKHNVQTFANLNVTDCRRPLNQITDFLKHVDVFIINSHEFADIVKTTHTAIDFHTNLHKKFASIFSERQIVVVTAGKSGSFAYTSEKMYHEPAVKDVQVDDTTGAGDAFTAGFISSYLKNQDLQKALHDGAAYSVKILTKLGAN
ncbi:MAG: carbohydrate kinase family protein [Weeksellaceae bacterium]